MRRAMEFAMATISAILIIAFGMVLLTMGPGLEEKFFPVLTEQEPSVVRLGNGSVLQMENTITKARDCRLAAIEWQVVIHGPVVTSRQPIPVSNLSGELVLRGNLRQYPKGRTHTGPFTANLPSFFFNADEIAGLALYDCHPFWLTPSVLGPFKIPPTDLQPAAPSYKTEPKPLSQNFIQ